MAPLKKQRCHKCNRKFIHIFECSCTIEKEDGALKKLKYCSAHLTDHDCNNKEQRVLDSKNKLREQMIKVTPTQITKI